MNQVDEDVWLPYENFLVEYYKLNDNYSPSMVYIEPYKSSAIQKALDIQRDIEEGEYVNIYITQLDNMNRLLSAKIATFTWNPLL